MEIYLGSKALDSLTSHAIDAVISKTFGVAVAWAKGRFRQHPDLVRPQYVALYDADGNILKSVKIERSGEEEDRTAEDRKRGKRLPPFQID